MTHFSDYSHMCEPKLHFIHLFSPSDLRIEFVSNEYNVSEINRTVEIILKANRPAGVEYYIILTVTDISTGKLPTI